jgi:hypothetical protein
VERARLAVQLPVSARYAPLNESLAQPAWAVMVAAVNSAVLSIGPHATVKPRGQIMLATEGKSCQRGAGARG